MLGCPSQRHGASCPRSDAWGSAPCPTAAEPGGSARLTRGDMACTHGPGYQRSRALLVSWTDWPAPGWAGAGAVPTLACRRMKPVGLPAATLGMLVSPHLGSWLAAPGGSTERGPGTAWTQLPGASSCTTRGQGRDRGMTGRGWRQGRRGQARRGSTLKSRPSSEPGATAGCAGSGVRYPVPECNAGAGT